MKIFKSKIFWVILGIGVIGLMLYIAYKQGLLPFGKKKGKGILHGGTGGDIPEGNTETQNKEKPKLTEIPKEKVELINRRDIPRNLLRLEKLPVNGSLPEFTTTNIAVQPGERYGMFEPNKEVVNTKPYFKDTYAIINGQKTNKKYTFLRVNRDGEYYYIAMYNATTKDKEREAETEFDQTKYDREVAPTIAESLYKEIHSWLPSDVERINAIIDRQTDERLKLIAEAYEKMYGRTLISDLLSEHDGAEDHAEQIQRLQKILSEEL